MYRRIRLRQRGRHLSLRLVLASAASVACLGGTAGAEAFDGPSAVGSQIATGNYGAFRADFVPPLPSLEEDVSVSWFAAEGTDDRGYSGLSSDGLEPFGAEDFGAQDRVPRIPEPMVFDLVRPLGAKRGEMEINSLMLVPLSRKAGGTSELPDPLGLVVRSRDRQQIEWAPEIEVALWDGFAVEFETPFEGSTLEAYKFAAQWTFGTAFEERFIHGTQVIVQYDLHPKLTTPTFLYLAGIRFDEVWSLLIMGGFRSEIKGPDIAERTERLLNVTLFADVSDRMTVGVETNYTGALNGAATWFVVPQFHWELTDHMMLQAGVGVRFTGESTLPQAAIRAIYSF